jgi:hypothetical protein
LAQVDNTVPPGANEDGAVQPALAVLEGAPNEKLAVRKMDERKIPVGFEKRNVLNPHDPRFDIVSQENEIVTIKYGGHALALISGSGQPLSMTISQGVHYLDIRLQMIRGLAESRNKLSTVRAN